MRIVFVSLLILTSASVWAEWLEFGEDDVAVLYRDPATIKKVGDIRSIWELQNLKQRDTRAVISRRGLFEYDCKLQRSRQLSVSNYSEPMANGIVLATNNIVLPSGPTCLPTRLVKPCSRTSAADSACHAKRANDSACISARMAQQSLQSRGQTSSRKSGPRTSRAGLSKYPIISSTWLIDQPALVG